MRIIHYSILALVASGLVACGGSSGDSDDNGTGGSNQNQAPVAANLSVEYDWAEDFEPIDVLSSSSGSSLTLESVGDAGYGTTAIEGNLVSYTPGDDFIGIDSFTYVISDGSLESEGTVEVEVVSTVAMEGRVVDSPIANATVSITIDGVVHQAEADDDGFYTLPLTIRSVESEEVIRITARGSEANGQEHVTLSSILVSAGRLLSQANDGGKITRREMNDVNVTHVTTARDVLTRRAAGDEAITQANISEFGNTIDPQLLIQMAAVTKLIIDDANFDLPAGYDSIEDFLNNNESYNEFVETASAGGDSSPLNQAIAETLDDPEIMPELRAEDLYGRYIQIERAPSFLKPAAYTTWSITQDGVAWYDVPAHFGGRATFSLNGNRMVVDNPSQALRQLEQSYTVSEATFEGRPEVAEAWLAVNDGYYYDSIVREITNELIDAQVISQSENELIIRYNMVIKVHGYTFEHEGKLYEVWSDEITESETDVRLVKAEAFLNSDLTFNVTDESTWLLPGIIPPAHKNTPTLMLYDLASDNTWRMPQAALYLHDVQYSMGSGYSEADLNGTWELSADNRHLTLTSASGDSVRFTRHRYDAEQKTVLAEYLFDGEPLITKLLHGMPLPQELDFSAVEQVTGSNLLFNSIIAYNHAIFWDENDRARVQSFMFDFAQDGTGEQVQGLCKGEMFWDSEVCSEPMKVPANTAAMTWEFKENNLFGELFAFDRSASSSSLKSMRYWVPLAFSGPDIFSVLEWNTWSYTDTGSVSMILEPRFNQYQLTERPETYQPESAVNFGAMNEVSGAFNHGYKVVNPQVDSVEKPLH